MNLTSVLQTYVAPYFNLKIKKINVCDHRSLMDTGNTNMIRKFKNKGLLNGTIKKLLSI